MATNIIFYSVLIIIIIDQTKGKVNQPTSWRPMHTTAPPQPKRLSPGTSENNEEELDLKYYNETCANDTECYSKFQESTVCRKGFCACADKFDTIDIFLGEAGTKKICTYAPQLFKPCQFICDSTATCATLEGYPTKVCQCLPPNKFINGGCYITCKDNEYYSSSQSTCFPKCKGNEIDINSTCYKLVGLNSFCVDDHQCMIAYSECKNRKCACRPGFTEKNNTCAAQVIPKGNNRNINCPVGLPHPTAICQHPTDNYCPYDTHECYNETTCCPRNCSVKMIDINGKCYSRLRFLHHPCEFQQQCYDPNTECLKGVCECVKGYKIETADGFNDKCVKQCRESEIRIGNDECYQALKIGDLCGKPSTRCPLLSDCDKQQKRCTCMSDTVQLGPSLCGIVPKCPNAEKSQISVGSNSTTEKVIDTTNSPISGSKRKEILSSVTFCKVKNRTYPLSADVKLVDKCQNGQYCAWYMDNTVLDNLGICCHRPEQKCPNGKKPTSTKSCDISNSFSCGPDDQCYQQLRFADPDNDPSGKYCCK